MKILSKSLLFAIFAAAFAACSNSGVAPATSAQNTSQNTNKSTEMAAIEDKRTAMHKRLDALVGEWNVEKSNYIALGGTAEKPIVSKDLICKREWITAAGNMFIKDETSGTFGGAYYRLGILGYSTIDKAYEWNTVDNFNEMMMTYKSEKGTVKPDGDIVMVGEFTDAGIFPNKSTTGKTIKQRTVIKIKSTDRNIMEIYFTLPGRTEFLADRVIATRRK